MSSATRRRCNFSTVAKVREAAGLVVLFHLPVKRRSSFEPEAAEEVKEDDKEEKKGFSMWESISAQVKSVFPAEEAPQSTSRQNSPLHVEADV